MLLLHRNRLMSPEPEPEPERSPSPRRSLAAVVAAVRLLSPEVESRLNSVPAHRQSQKSPRSRAEVAWSTRVPERPGRQTSPPRSLPSDVESRLNSVPAHRQSRKSPASHFGSLSVWKNEMRDNALCVHGGRLLRVSDCAGPFPFGRWCTP